ncbi:MAG: Molybdopterin converting factor [Myxococcales bacterium]|nr:Molybdopterin converting factor [Myxococcales bacterium]
MARVCFTQNLQRDVPCPEEELPGTTVREVLDAYFLRHPEARSYVLDERGGLRTHVAIFIGDCRATDRLGLSDVVERNNEVWVMQALSGG